MNKNKADDTFYKYEGVVIPEDIDHWIKQKQQYINFLSDIDQDYDDLSESDSQEQTFDYYENYNEKLKKKFLKAVVPTQSFLYLQIQPTEDIRVIREAFNAKVLVMHPDKGGDKEQFQKLLKHKTKCFLYARRYQDNKQDRFQNTPADLSEVYNSLKKGK